MSTTRQPVNCSRGQSSRQATTRRKTLRVKSIPEREATGTIHDNESLTLDAFCRRLRVTAAEVVRYRRSGLRAVRVGRQIQIRGRDWNQWLDAQPTAPVPRGKDGGTTPNADQDTEAIRADQSRPRDHDSAHGSVGRSGEDRNRSSGRSSDCPASDGPTTERDG